jgi:type II restriction enzyme
MESRGWTIEIMKIVEQIDKASFNLKDVYAFENFLKDKFPKNRFIKPKIRQQLQILRDKHFLEFLGDGEYKKI